MPPWPLIDPFQFPVWTVARENANYQIFRCWLRLLFRAVTMSFPQNGQVNRNKIFFKIFSILRELVFLPNLAASSCSIFLHLVTFVDSEKSTEGEVGCVVLYQLDRRFLEFDSPLFATAHKKGKQVVGVGFHQTPLLSLPSNLSLCTPFLHFKHQPFDIGVRNMFSYASFPHSSHSCITRLGNSVSSRWS